MNGNLDILLTSRFYMFSLVGAKGFEPSDSLLPKEKRYEVAGGGGLSIRVLPGGGKAIQYHYRFNGVARRMTLGTYLLLVLQKPGKNMHRLCLTWRTA